MCFDVIFDANRRRYFSFVSLLYRDSHLFLILMRINIVIIRTIAILARRYKKNNFKSKLKIQYSKKRDDLKDLDFRQRDEIAT